jgi:hypothetical protein
VVVALALDDEVDEETDTEVELDVAALDEDEEALLELVEDALADEDEEEAAAGALQRPRIPRGSIKQPRFSTAPA